MDLTPLLAAIASRRALPSREAADDEFWRAAREQRVHALLAQALVSEEWPGAPAARRAARAELAAAVAQWTLRKHDLLRVLDCLDRHGVRPTLIKGAALACTHYARPHLRPSLDLDLLITETEVSAAQLAFESLGATLIPHVTGRLVMPQFHYDTSDASGCVHSYDIHWRIVVPPRFAGALSPEEIAAEAVPIGALGPFARGACAVHALLLASVHRAAHHRANGPLIWLKDVDLLCEGLTHAEEDRVCELSRSRGIVPAVTGMLTDAHAAFAGAGTGRLAARLATTGEFAVARPEPKTRMAASFEDFRALGWPDRIRLARQLLAPGPEYMRKTYAPGSRSPLPLLYLRRIASGAWRWSGR